MRTPLILALALALTLGGCIQNMSDLKDRMSGEAATTETVEPATIVDPTPTPGDETPTSAPAKAPVARMSVFGANGALLYKASFTAEDAASIVFVDEKSKLNVIASDSEALETGAKITGFGWTLNGKPIDGARQASVDVGEAGVYVLTLTVTDSNGKTDAQTVKLGVAAKPYDVVTEIMTGPIGGGNGQGLAEDHPFTLAADDSKPSTVQKVTIVAKPDLGLDVKITILDANGEVMGDADKAGHTDLDQTETIELAAIPLGAYTIHVESAAGIDHDGVPITITVTYLPIVPGLSGADGHNHSH
jgi:hypothetical protein